MLPFIERVKTWWATADSKQKVVTLGGIGALLLVLLGTAVFVTRPHYETLYEGLTDTEKASVVEALKAGADPLDPQINRPGAIDLPAAQIALAHMKLATAGKTPKGVSHWGANELAKGGLLTSPGTEAQMLNTVREGEIASALETMQGVGSATVLITTPKEQLFADNKGHPTASVSIVENGQGGLTATNGRTIASLVCSAVEGMTPADVFVASNTLGELWNGRNGNATNDKWDQDKKVAADVGAQIQSALDATLGQGNTKVLVRADVGNGEHSVTTDTDEPSKKPVVTTKEGEDMQNARNGVGGAAGSTSNTTQRAPATPPEDGNGNGVYKKTGVSSEFGHNRSEEVTKDGAGGLKGLAISVIANSDKVPDESKVKSIVGGYMADLIKTDNGGTALLNQPFTTTVTSLKFDGASAQAAKDATDRLAGQQRMQQILSLLPLGAVLAVALLVAKQVGKISRSILPALPDPSEAGAGASLAEGPDALEAGESLGMLPEAAFLEGLADQFDTATLATLPTRSSRADLFDEEDLPPALRPIKDRVDMPLETIKLLAEQRPELVATLIKSVMLGEKL